MENAEAAFLALATTSVEFLCRLNDDQLKPFRIVDSLTKLARRQCHGRAAVRAIKAGRPDAHITDRRPGKNRPGLEIGPGS